jgi:DNA/RNA-binding domain of Phe-tRNA-synthetase-like protein
VNLVTAVAATYAEGFLDWRNGGVSPSATDVARNILFIHAEVDSCSEDDVEALGSFIFEEAQDGCEDHEMARRIVGHLQRSGMVPA